MAWKVEFDSDFKKEYNQFNEYIREELLAKALMLEAIGPHLGRPHVDTLKGSAFSNMKELRFEEGKEVWRVAFAFDPDRNAILLTGADKRGKNQKQFYNDLIALADFRYSKHLEKIKNKKDHGHSTSKSTRRISKGKAGKNKGKGN